MKRTRTLRLRLLLAGVAGVLIAAGMAAWLLGAAFEAAALRALDRRLSDSLDGLIGVAEYSPGNGLRLKRQPSDGHYARVFSGWYWQIDAEDGTSLQSRSLWDSHLSGAWEAERQYGYTAGPREQQLRVLSQQVRLASDEKSVRFLVATDLADIQAEANDFRWYAAIAVALLALTMLSVILWQVNYGLRPLDLLDRTLRRMKEGEEVRFDLATLPGEVAPLADQINKLLDEHARQVERARHTANDLAHALKTPLAVLAAESQRPGPALADVVAKQAQAMQVVVDRRLRGSLVSDSRQHCEVAPALSALRDMFVKMQGDRAVDIVLLVAGEPMFAGACEDLEEMLGNLLDNACKWARGRVQVEAKLDGARVHVAIEDDGPGLDAGAREQAMKRGVRLDLRVTGSGLGLAIVEEIASSYGGQVRLESSAMGGLRAVLDLPAYRPEI